jgi:hypothetical protein
MARGGGSTRAAPRCTDQRVVGCLGVRAHGVGIAVGARTACAPVSAASAREHHVPANPLQVALFDRDLLAFLQLKCAT